MSAPRAAAAHGVCDAVSAPRTAVSVLALTLALALAPTLALTVPRDSSSQDFAPAAPAGPQAGAAALLERALPLPDDALSLESSTTRWLGMEALETRAVALGLGPGSLRVAAGLSQTGDPELGWTALALAVGAAGAEGGAGVRVAGRRDRAAGAVLDGRLALDSGYEAGAGVWLAAAPGLALWAVAAQLWTGGEAPPLARPLELGGRWSARGLSAWAGLVAPQRGDDGERFAGLAVGAGGLTLWGEARDGPLRGSVGVRGAVGPLVAEARADAHPVLAETTRLALAWRRRGKAAGP